METLCRLSYRGRYCLFRVFRGGETTRRAGTSGNQPPGAVDETLALPVEAALTKRDMQRIVSACNALGGLLQSAY